MRLLLTLLAFLGVVLAILFNTWWLYVLAVLVVAAAIGAWSKSYWDDRSTKPPRESAGPTTQDELAALGIMEIREKSSSDEASRDDRSTPDAGTVREKSFPARAPDRPKPQEDDKARPAKAPPGSKPQTPQEPKSTNSTEVSMDQDVPDDTTTRPTASQETQSAAEDAPSSVTDQPESRTRSQPSESGDRPHPPQGASRKSSPSQEAANGSERSDVDRELLSIVAPYLESLRSATQAQTATLLVQDEVAISYRVQAIASEVSHTLSEGSQFKSQVPLLTANLSRQPASIRLVGSDVDKENLGYYSHGHHGIQEIGIAPVSRPDHPSTFFLLVDTPHAFEWKRVQRLLARYADLLAVILNTHDSDDEMVAGQTEDISDGVDREALPPRRQVIAEEMERARAHDQEMALAILYLNRAESIASKGDTAVAGAEKALHSWLESTAPNSRVEPFGELTYGVFFDGNVHEAEAWAAKIQKKSEEAPSPLEGGVSIGLSMLRPRHQSPDALRNDATEALREAYTTGTCTILE